MAERAATDGTRRVSGAHTCSSSSGQSYFITPVGMAASGHVLAVLMPTVCGGRSRSARPAPCVSMLIGSNSWGAEGVEQVGLVEIYGGATSSYAGIPPFRGRTAGGRQDARPLEERKDGPLFGVAGVPASYSFRARE